MATSNIKTPESFNFSKPEEFDKWIKRVDRYLQAANVTQNARKVNYTERCTGM